MVAASVAVAEVECEKLSVQRQIKTLERQASQLEKQTSHESLSSLLNQHADKPSDSLTAQLQAMQKIKKIRAEIQTKVETVKQINDRVNFETDKIKSLENELVGIQLGAEIGEVSLTYKLQNEGYRNRSIGQRLSYSPPARDANPRTAAASSFQTTHQMMFRGGNTDFMEDRPTRGDRSRSKSPIKLHSGLVSNDISRDHAVEQPSRMTYALETLLNENRQLRDKVKDRDTQISNLEKINTSQTA